MKNLKKLLALAVVLAMVLTTLSSMFVVSAFTDVTETSAYYEAVTILNKLGIVNGKDENTFGPADTIKRSEAAAIVVRMLGLETAAEGSKGATAYKDVPADHWASGYINVATAQGVINGHGDGTFAPDDDVTYEQFVKMVMVALGYEPVAQGKGGYPTGYLVAASDYGVTSGISFTGSKPAPRGDIALIVYQALDAPILEQTGWGTNINYEVRDGKGSGNVKKTLLSEKLNIYKMTAQITANDKSSITSASGAQAPGYVAYTVLDLDYADYGKDFQEGATGPSTKVGKSGVEDLLGYKVVLYVGQDSYKEYTVVAAVQDNSQIDELTLAGSKYLDDAKTKTNLTEAKRILNYWKNPDTDRKSTEVKIADQIAMMINGKYYTSDIEEINDYLTETWLDTNGSVRLVNIDSNKNDTFDYIYLTTYKQGLVEEVDLTTQTISFSDGNIPTSICLDPEDFENPDFIYTMKDTSGKDLTINDIKENDVLAIAFSDYEDGYMDDSDYMDIVVVRNTVNGVVTEKNTSGSDDEYYIAGSYYELSDAANFNSIKLEDEGIFYLDIEGKILARKINTEAGGTSKGGYVFLNAVGNGSTGGLENDYQLRVMRADGKVEKVTLGNTVRVINDGGIDVNKNYTSTGAAGKNLSDLRQKLAYIVNGADESARVMKMTIVDGTVSRIELAIGSTRAEENYFTNNGEYTGSYRASTKRFGNRYQLTDNTIVFYVPDADDYESYEVRKATSFSDEAEYTITLFDLNRDNEPALVLLTEDAGFGDYTTGRMAMVSRVTQAISKVDGVTYVDALVLIQDGKETASIPYATKGYKVYAAGEDEDDANLVPAVGDAIMYDTNANGEINKVAIIFDQSEQKLFATELDGVNDRISFVFGKVYKAGAKPELAGNSAETYLLDLANNGVTYALYDQTNTRTNVRVARNSDMAAYNEKKGEYYYVVSRLFDGYAQDIAIYRYANPVDAGKLDISAIGGPAATAYLA